MALHAATFKTRALSAAIFVVVMLAGLLIDDRTFFLLFSVIHFGCWVEYQKIIGSIDERYRSISFLHRYGVMITGWCLMLCFMSTHSHPGATVWRRGGCWLGMAVAAALVLSDLFSKPRSFKNAGYSLLGILYISLSFALLTDLLTLSGISTRPTPLFPIVIIACMWINDTMAYLVGSLIGKTPLSAVSPKKTWEGTIGGIILCVLVVSIASRFIGPLQHFRAIDFIMIPLIAAVAGTFGDLLESKLKRLAGFKDSGSIMPGHGGFLDRFDSLLLATPFVWLYVRLFIQHT